MESTNADQQLKIVRPLMTSIFSFLIPERFHVCGFPSTNASSYRINPVVYDSRQPLLFHQARVQFFDNDKSIKFQVLLSRVVWRKMEIVLRDNHRRIIFQFYLLTTARCFLFFKSPVYFVPILAISIHFPSSSSKRLSFCHTW